MIIIVSICTILFTPADVHTFPAVHLRTTEEEVDMLTINNWKWIPLINSR